MAEETYFDKISKQIKTGNEPYTWYRNRIKELGTPYCSRTYYVLVN